MNLCLVLYRRTFVRLYSLETLDRFGDRGRWMGKNPNS